MLKKEVLPIGTIIYLKNSLKKIMIVNRLILIPDEETGEEKVFDYSGVAYPEGIINQEIIAFNEEEINSIKFLGYTDDEEQELVKRLLDWQNERFGIQIKDEEESKLEL